MKITQLIEGKQPQKIPASKPRNFVAKNATGSGAGAHKDKKKAQKQGDVKHKGKELADLEEGHKILPNIDTDRYTDLSDQGLEGPFRLESGKVVYYDPKAGKYYDRDTDMYLSDDEYEQHQNANESQSDDPELKQTMRDAQRHYPGGTKTGAFNKFVQRSLKHSKEDDVKLKKQVSALTKKVNSLKEGFDPEYDDEAGMADNNLETLERAVQGIDDLISAGDNLPEWCQEKIAVAKSMLVTVWDYMKSEEMDEGYYRRPGRPDAYDRDYQSSISGMGKRDSLAYQMDGGANDEGWDEEPSGRYQAPQDKPVLQGYYFYNVPAGKEQEAATYGLKQTKSGKWAKAKYNTSGRSFGMQKDMADKAFGPGRWWSPK